MSKALIVVPVTCLLLLLLALVARWPYAFYVLLRLVVCVSAVYFAFLSRTQGRILWFLLMLGIALLYNPVFPVRMARGSWQLVNVVTFVPIAAWSVSQARRNRSSGE